MHAYRDSVDDLVMGEMLLDPSGQVVGTSDETRRMLDDVRRGQLVVGIGSRRLWPEDGPEVLGAVALWWATGTKNAQILAFESNEERHRHPDLPLVGEHNDDHLN